ncbi:biofilm/acid-resistance regulator YmgB/AriR [Candidatus Pantoea formicae]|uniref:biofilm/acid-resistance regulator YmgB/AriR n=1 Tax=Candidatus Pantoea formicae TaxID=2608355 RepID=UPI003EDB21E5
MQPTVTMESQLLDFFHTTGDQFLSERAIIAEIRLELSAQKMRISNKDIILALILRLECESDVIKQDIYRNALEIIVQRTPDDIS